MGFFFLFSLESASKFYKEAFFELRYKITALENQHQASSRRGTAELHPELPSSLPKTVDLAIAF